MPKNTVKLVSREGFEFVVDYKAACVSNTIRNMLSSQGEWESTRSPHASIVMASITAGTFTETELGEVKFPEIPTPILEKVCQYFYYKLRYQNS